MRKTIASLGVGILLGLSWWFVAADHGPAPSDAPRETADRAPAPVLAAGAEPADAVAQVMRGVLEPAAPAHRLRIRVVEEDTAVPLPGLACEMAPGDGRTATTYRAVGTTSEAGEILVADAVVGQHAVRVCGSHTPTWADVGRGTESVVVVTVPAVTRFTGMVVDVQHEPLAGAEIWLSGRMLEGREQLVATAQTDGRFAFDARGLDRFVTARLAGLGCSLSVPTGQPAFETEPVVLVLGRPVARASAPSPTRAARRSPAHGSRWGRTSARSSTNSRGPAPSRTRRVRPRRDGHRRAGAFRCVRARGG